jgi:F-type H+-transporting ATPase subunit epsilon
MRLRVVTPLSVVVDEDVISLRAEDASGSFGIRTGHTPFLTALAISIVSWQTEDTERFCAVRGGVLTVSTVRPGTSEASGTSARSNRSAGSEISETSGTVAITIIAIATREAVVGDRLAFLDADVMARFQSDAEEQRTENAASMVLQLNAIRRMVSRLGSSTRAGEFR